MPVSLSSFEHARRVACGCLLAAFSASWLNACTAVRPQDKEHLAEHAMMYRTRGLADAHERHVLDNREGTTGGGSTHGGGCGCN